MKKLEISKLDLEYNLTTIKKIIKNKNSETQIIAVVKANGMGLDLIKYSKFLVENGIKCLAVANVEEALKLRESGIEEKIIMLSPISNKKELQLLIESDITITIGSLEEFNLAEEICKFLQKEIKAHIKIDTGFGRYGFVYLDKEKVLEIFQNSKKVKIEGMFTHFSKPTNSQITNTQFERFIEVANYIKSNNFKIEILHACASTAFLKYPNMWLDAVRLGSIIQGRTMCMQEEFRKIGTFKSYIEEIKVLPKGYNISYGNTYKTKKETKIAVIPVGYVDGFNKNKLRDDFTFKNNIIAIGMEIKKLFKDNSLKVKINGNKYKVLGRLGMYHTIVDITGTENIAIGAEVQINIQPLQANDEIRREYI